MKCTNKPKTTNYKVVQYRSRLIDKMSKPLFTKIYDFLNQHKQIQTAEKEVDLIR
jgi:hypothetical protein